MIRREARRLEEARQSASLPDAPLLELELPELRVLADYTIGDRTGERELRPQALVLLPDEKRMYVVYRMSFQVPRGPRARASFSLEDGDRLVHRREEEARCLARRSPSRTI